VASQRKPPIVPFRTEDGKRQECACAEYVVYAPEERAGRRRINAISPWCFIYRKKWQPVHGAAVPWRRVVFTFTACGSGGYAQESAQAAGGMRAWCCYAPKKRAALFFALRSAQRRLRFRSSTLVVPSFAASRLPAQANATVREEGGRHKREGSEQREMGGGRSREAVSRTAQ